MKIKATLTETISYEVEIEVPDSADESDIADAAEDAFVQGHYRVGHCYDRQMDSWEKAA